MDVNNQNKDQTKNEDSDEAHNDLTIVVNTSAVNTSNVNEEFKHGFSLNDLYKISLEFYKRGEYHRADPYI